MENKPNNFIIFLKSLLPMLLSLSVMLAVNFIIIIVIGVKAAANNLSLYDPNNLDAFQLAFEMDYYTMAASATVNTITTVSVYVLISIIFGIWFFKSDYSRNMTPLKKALPVKNVVLICIAGFFTQYGIDMLLELLLPLFPRIEAQYSQTMGALTTGSIIAVLFTTVFLAPFVEELIFRGLTFKSTYRHWKSFAFVNCLQALYFGIYHMNIVQGIYAFVLGAALGYVAFKLDNIFASILFHASVNLSAFLVFIPQAIEDTKIIWIFLAVFSLVIVVAMLYLLEIPQKEVISTNNIAGTPNMYYDNRYNSMNYENRPDTSSQVENKESNQ